MSDPSQISAHTTNGNMSEETPLLDDQSLTTLENLTDETENILESETTAKDEADDKNDSEYEDVEDEENEEEDFDERNKTAELTSIVNKSSFKENTEEDEVDIDVKPRRAHSKRQEDEQSEGVQDDDDNQNVPDTKSQTTSDVNKSDKTKAVFDDDNNTQSPAYVPRRGKFYEHDDRTSDENDQLKPEVSKSAYHRDLDGKWQHDLYFQDEQKSASRRPLPRQERSHVERDNQKRVHLKDYMPRSDQKQDHDRQQRYDNNYRPRIPHDNYAQSHPDRMNSFTLKDYGRALSDHRTGQNKETNSRQEVQVTSRRPRHDYDTQLVDERTFHRRRSFTNSQFHQQENFLSFNPHPHRNDQRRLGEQINGSNQFKDGYDSYHYGSKNRDFKREALYENKSALPPRLQLNNKNNHRNLIQKQPYQQKSSSNLSPDVLNNERPKRYSDMRNNMTSSLEQQTLSSQMQHYQDQRSNKTEQNDWPQAPPPPTSFLPHQIITPQMFYQQQKSSRYMPMTYSQTSLSQQPQEKK